MAISFIGSATGTNTATMPAHVAGDLIVVAAYRYSNSTISQPGGWTDLSTVAGSISRSVGYKIAASTSEVVGTWTNADVLAVHVYRGAYGITTSIFPSTSTSTTATYQMLGQMNNVTSWIAAFAATTSIVSTIENPPAGMILRQNSVGASGELASFDTNSGYVGIWPATNVALGGSYLRSVITFEILESPRAVTMQPGSYALSGANTPIFDLAASPISFIGAANGTNTATLPAHQAGDLIIAIAHNNAAAIAPTAPGGWTTMTTSTGSGRGLRPAYKLAASSSETVDTWTNATEIMVLVYRGAKNARITGTTFNNSGSATLQYNAGTLLDTDGRSQVLCGAFAVSLTTAVETTPPKTTLRLNSASATVEYAAFDTNGGTTSWPLSTLALGSSAPYYTFSIEIRAPQNLSISPDPGSYAISGADTSIARAYTIAADPGSYMLSGADTPFIRSLLISAAPGAYALSGANTTLDTARYIIADPGSYAISGASTALVRSLLMSADSGSYSISGAATGVLRSLVISPAPGSYALSGADTLLEKGYVISAEAGSYSINGADTSLIRALEIVAAPGAYVLGGADAPLYAGRVVNAEPGSYVINGSDVTFELTVVSIRLKRFVGGVWETNRLKEYCDGEWVKPNLKRYVSGVWVQVND